MNKRTRLILVLAIVLLLAAAWTWRYVTMNRYYDELDNGNYKLYQLGDEVPFEDDGNDFYTDLNGYYLRVDKFEIQDYDTYLDNADFTVERDEFDPEKIALVFVTLRNENCEPNPVSLIDFNLHGFDSVASMNWDILAAANPLLEGNTAVAVSTGHACQFILPYELDKDQYSSDTWRNIDDYKFYLKVTSTLTTKEILINV